MGLSPSKFSLVVLKKRGGNLLQLTLMSNSNLYKRANMICTNLYNFGCTKLYHLKIDFLIEVWEVMGRGLYCYVLVIHFDPTYSYNVDIFYKFLLVNMTMG